MYKRVSIFLSVFISLILAVCVETKIINVNSSLDTVTSPKADL